MLLQGIFPTEGLNLGLLHCRQILYYLKYQGSPVHIEKEKKKKAIFFHFIYKFSKLCLGFLVYLLQR